VLPVYRPALYLALILFVVSVAAGMRMLDQSRPSGRSGSASLSDKGVWELPPAPSIVVSGAARVVDGDTVSIGQQRIRLFGIDAPELSQQCGPWQCGREAKMGLTRIIGASELRCVGDAHDAYGRLIATCRLDHEDVGRVLVRNGMAFAYTAFSTRYENEELLARTEGLGVWAHPATKAPWLYRESD